MVVNESSVLEVKNSSCDPEHRSGKEKRVGFAAIVANVRQMKRPSARLIKAEATLLSLRRADEASEGKGYTLGEAAALARSSVPGQRAAALRLLAAVLDQARLLLDEVSLYHWTNKNHSVQRDCHHEQSNM